MEVGLELRHRILIGKKQSASILRVVNKMKKILLMILIGLFGCASKPLAVSDVVGTYKGIYGGAEEFFEIDKDGTFTQRLILNGNQEYTNKGTWKIVDKPTSKIFLKIATPPKIIVFNHFLESIDHMTGKLLQPAKLINGKQGDWDESRQGIEFFIEQKYVVYKQISTVIP